TIVTLRFKDNITVPFTALAGDWHRHWFLKANLIDQQQMSKGDN
ncbi:MAG: DUF2316 domain-containing protein, partial [Lactococcus lactis]|nr:DUF2316 domain-containing protein [Lactococcus lactis]